MIKLLCKNKVVYVILGAFVAIGVPVNYFFLKDSPDNSLEEVQEEIISDIVGIELDLSPNSKE